MVDKKVTLPNEEGEWEAVGYEFQGEPGGDASVTVKEWPGMTNLRVYRRVEEKAVLPELEVGDSLQLPSFANSLTVIGVCPVRVADTNGCSYVLNVAEFLNITRVMRNGEIIFSGFLK